MAENEKTDIKEIQAEQHQKPDGILDSPRKSRHKKQNIYLDLYTFSFSDVESILLAE